MNLQAANLLVTLLFVFYRLLKGQSSSCSALNALTQNSNSSEVSCSVQSSCFLQCTNRNNQLETVVDLFHLTVLPCAEPSPAVRIELLGQIDFAVQNGQRRTQLNETLTETDSLVQYSVIISGIVFGVYEFMVNASNSSSNIGISVQLTVTGTETPVTIIGYTEVQLDSFSCSASTTTAAATTGTPFRDDPLTATDGSPFATPTGMNISDTLLGTYTSRDLQLWPSLVLNFILVCLTVVLLHGT